MLTPEDFPAFLFSIFLPMVFKITSEHDRKKSYENKSGIMHTVEEDLVSYFYC